MRYVIIGGQAAGMSAAMHIVRKDKGAKITVLEKGAIYSYGQCGLPYVINDVIPSTSDVIARPVETFRNRYGIDAKVNSKVTKVHTEEQYVEGVYTDSQETFRFAYDRLLIASGAHSYMPPWPGAHLKGVHTLKTIADAERLMTHLQKDVQRIVIVGGGYIGLEMAESFASLDKNVTIIQRGNQLANIFDKEIAELIHEEAKRNGVNLVLEESVEALNGDETVKAVTTDKGSYQADLVLVAVGVRPNTHFLQSTEVHLHPNGAIKVNAYMETNVKNLYAAGDCATQYHLVKQKDDYIPLGSTANKQGQIAGANMVGQTLTFQGVTGTSLIKFFDLSLGKTGLSEKEATALHIPYKTQTLQVNDIAGYYPDSERLHVKLLYTKKEQRLLGGQIIGKKGVDKRIDVLATALYNRMAVHDLIHLDLGYAPPFNAAWDPIQQVARRT